MSQKIKQTVIALVIIVVAFVGFQKFFAPESASNATLVSEKNDAQKFVDGQAILALLNRLNKVTLNDAIFSSAVFNSLVSFERSIPDQVVARPNPFAPIGTDSDAR